MAVAGFLGSAFLAIADMYSNRRWSGWFFPAAIFALTAFMPLRWRHRTAKRGTRSLAMVMIPLMALLVERDLSAGNYSLAAVKIAVILLYGFDLALRC